MRLFWKLFSRFFVVPWFRLGLGPFFGNPVTGYVMVLRTTGRNSGRVRDTPTVYAMAGGSVYCLAGYGRSTDWFQNAIAARDVSLVLPGGAISGQVEEVEDAAERLTAIRQIFRNSGLMGFTEGFNPFLASDETIRSKTADMPVLRIRPTGIAGGASDPGGRAWIWVPILVGAAVVVVAVGRLPLSSLAASRRSAYGSWKVPKN